MSERATVVALRAAPVLFVLTALALVRPFGDFPLNDDWAYAYSVRVLLEEGQLRLSDWVPASTVFHIVWGAAWSLALGESFAVLRLSVVFWLALGAFLLPATLRRLGASEGAAALAGLAFAANPLALSFGLTYHTDVPFVALGIASLYALVRFDQDGALGWLWLSSACAAAAITTRQIGVGFEAGIVVLLVWRGRRDAAGWIAALLPPVLATSAYLIWIETVHEATWAMDAYLLDDSLRYLARPAVWIPETLRRALGGGAYAALFALPLVVASRPGWRSLGFAGAGLCAAVAWGSLGNWPYFANSFGPGGLGTVTLHSPLSKAAGFFASPLFAFGLTAAAWAAFSWTLAPGAKRPERSSQALCNLYLGTWLLVFLLMLPKSTFFDRYVLVLLPPALVWSALKMSELTPRRVAGSLCAWALLAGIALVGTLDYHAWNEAKWKLGRRALAQGIAPGDVAAGIDWDAHWTYQRNMAQLKATRPLSEIGRFDWQVMNRKRSLVAFSPQSPPWVEVVDEEPYRTPLAASGSAILYRIERPPQRGQRR